MLESRVLFTHGVSGEIESVQEHKERSAFGRLFGKLKLHGPYHRTSGSRQWG